MLVSQGIAYAADFAVIGILTSHWAALTQHAFFLSVLTCYSPLSLTITNFFSGFVSSAAFFNVYTPQFSYANLFLDGLRKSLALKSVRFLDSGYSISMVLPG